MSLGVGATERAPGAACVVLPPGGRRRGGAAQSEAMEHGAWGSWDSRRPSSLGPETTRSVGSDSRRPLGDLEFVETLGV